MSRSKRSNRTERLGMETNDVYGKKNGASTRVGVDWRRIKYVESHRRSVVCSLKSLDMQLYDATSLLRTFTDWDTSL